MMSLCFNSVSGLEELNRVVPEAFLPFFIKTVGHFSKYVVRNGPDAAANFQKRSFCKAIESKSTRRFVKKFVQTQMFDLFIQEVEQRPASQKGHTHPSYIHTYYISRHTHCPIRHAHCTTRQLDSSSFIQYFICVISFFLSCRFFWAEDLGVSQEDARESEETLELYKHIKYTEAGC